MRTYKQYPYYDDVFSPLGGLAQLIKNGGWHSKLSIPSSVRFILDASGRVGIYRQSPALAHAWTTVSEVATMTAEALRNRFQEVALEAFSQDKVPYCSACDWRSICGGLDLTTDCRPTNQELDTMCGHRKLFLSTSQHCALLIVWSDHLCLLPVTMARAKTLHSTGQSSDTNCSCGVINLRVFLQLHGSVFSLLF